MLGGDWMSSLSALAFRPIAQNIRMGDSARGMTRAPGFYSDWTIEAGGGGGAGVGHMGTPTWGYGQGGLRSNSFASNKSYNRTGVWPNSGGPRGPNGGGKYGDGTGGVNANGRDAQYGGSHGEFGWHDPSIREPRGSMPTAYKWGGNRGVEVLPDGQSTYYGEAGRGGIPASNIPNSAVDGEDSALGYNSGTMRVLYG